MLAKISLISNCVGSNNWYKSQKIIEGKMPDQSYNTRECVES